MIRSGGPCVLLVLALLGVAGCGSKPPTTGGGLPTRKEGEAELKWSRQIAEQFLQAIIDQQLAEAVACGNSGFQKRMREQGDSAFDTPELKAADGFCRVLYGPRPKSEIPKDEMWRTFALKDEGVRSPTGDEMRFTGTLTKAGGKASAPFDIRLTRDRDANQWRVDFFSVAKLEK